MREERGGGERYECKRWQCMHCIHPIININCCDYNNDYHRVSPNRSSQPILDAISHLQRLRQRAKRLIAFNSIAQQSIANIIVKVM